MEIQKAAVKVKFIIPAEGGKRELRGEIIYSSSDLPELWLLTRNYISSEEMKAVHSLDKQMSTQLQMSPLFPD